MDGLAKKMGLRIKEKREEKGFNQKEFADLIGVSPSAVNQYESGVKKPSTDYLAIIASKLGVNADYLLGLSDKEDHLTQAYQELKSLNYKDQEIILANIRTLKQLRKKS